MNEHTDKVIYLGPTVAGKKHDKKAAEEEEIAYPTNATLAKDTGFQGYEPAGVLTRQPKTERPGVERGGQIPSSSHLQRPRGCRKCDCRGETVSDCHRCLTSDHRNISDLVMEIACGLHNLRVSCRHPFPAFDVLSLLGSANPIMSIIRSPEVRDLFWTHPPLPCPSPGLCVRDRMW